MADLFHESVSFDFVDQVFAAMALANRHTYQILTKRPNRMRDYLLSRTWKPDRPVDNITHEIEALGDWSIEAYGMARRCQWPLPNVWLGVSVEDQRRADERIPILLQTPATIRFLSIEPLLGPIDLGLWLDNISNLSPVAGDWCPPPATPSGWYRMNDLDQDLHWVIVGGESGGPADRRLVQKPLAGGWPPRSMAGDLWVPKPQALEWVRSLRDQCQAAGVSFFFKQWGGPTPKSGGRLIDGVDWNEMPVVFGQ